MATAKAMKTYLDPSNPGSFGGVERFRKEAKLTRKEAEQALQHVDEYTVTKESKKRFKRNKIVVTNMQQQFQIDLADMTRFASENNHVKFLLFAIDCFSRKLSVQPIRKKTPDCVVKAMAQVFRELGPCDKIQVDKGTEFKGSFKREMATRGIHLFTSENDDIKCSMVERVIRTIKGRVWRLFRHRNSTKYVDKLKDIVAAYNNSEHSAHGRAPSDVSQANSLEIFEALFKDQLTPKKPKFSVGDRVRIRIKRSSFTKGYENRFHEEIFVIKKVLRHPIPVYTIKDLLGEPVYGKFYESELSKVLNYDHLKETVIEKILSKRRNKVLVKVIGQDEPVWIDGKSECLKDLRST